MTGDALEPIRYIGQRLRSWRHERNWSGQEAADRLAARLGRAVEWPELRRYEEATALPDERTASHLAAAYGRRLSDLLTLSKRASAVVLDPWPPTVPSKADLEAVEQLLRNRSHDPRHAARLFELGLSKGSAGAWLRRFSPEDAFGWIAVRFGPSEAARWADRGYTVEDAINLKSLGLSPDELPTSRSGSTGSAVATEVVVVRDQLGLVGDDSTGAWTSQGWDLLTSIPWHLAGFDPASANSWDELGFDPLEARDLMDRYSPEQAKRWRETPIEPPVWDEWRAAGFGPPDAALFATAGFDAIESARWRDADFAASEAARWAATAFGTIESTAWREAGFDPDEASGYRTASLDASGASAWRSVGVGPADVHKWRDLDLQPADVQRWSEVSDNPSVIAAVASTGLTPERAAQYLDVGIGSQDIECWHDAGFAPEQASPWAGTSPERARRLLAKGISPEFDRSRRAVGAQRVAAARAALSEQQTSRTALADRRRPSTPAVPASTGFDHGTFNPGCASCGQPVGVNGRCGCS